MVDPIDREKFENTLNQAVKRMGEDTMTRLTRDITTAIMRISDREGLRPEDIEDMDAIISEVVQVIVSEAEGQGLINY